MIVRIAVYCILFGFVVLGVAVPPASARQLPPCDDHTAAPSPSDAAIEVKPNEKRPVIQIPLGDKDKSDGDVTLRTVPSIGQTAQVAAEVNDTPVTGADELRGLSLGARPSDSGTGLIVHVCADRSGVGAGRYEGSVRIYGPTIKSLDYPVTVTVKAEKYVAGLLLGGGILVAIVVALLSGALRFTGNWLASIAGYALGVVLMIVAGVAAYYSIYKSNQTWGDDPGKDYPAIAIAGFSAASAALVALHKLLAKPS